MEILSTGSEICHKKSELTESFIFLSEKLTRQVQLALEGEKKNVTGPGIYLHKLHMYRKRVYFLVPIYDKQLL